MKRTYLDPSKVDLSKVDIHNDFRDFPPLYNTPADIEKFIMERKMNLPVLVNLLNWHKEGKLDITPTESKLYFDELFDYIYDVYRIPVEETYKNMEEWLKHIEVELVYNGFGWVKSHAFEFIINKYNMSKETEKLWKEFGIYEEPACINFYKDIGENNPYYNSKNPELIESFWIKSSRFAGQPVHIGDEAYMRVHVYPSRVYIFGCDDSSYTLKTETRKDAEEFAKYLKCASPVWDFNNLGRIHRNLEFTN